ncbi:hypothetical protein N9A49_06755, partial [Salibacteraceae bacterium]|nr:hypothetical protein [Salibacteraceae bacterium]
MLILPNQKITQLFIPSMKTFLLSFFVFTVLQQKPPKGLDLNQAINQGADKELIQNKGYTAKEYVKIDSTWYINPEGTFYLFDYDEKKNQFTRLDQSIHHGATYGRFL